MEGRSHRVVVFYKFLPDGARLIGWCCVVNTENWLRDE